MRIQSKMKYCFCLMAILALLSVKSLNAETVTERDPTQPAVLMPATDAIKEKEPVYILRSTIISSTRKLALIAEIPADSLQKTGEELGKIIDTALETARYVTVGGKIGNATVTVIKEDSVVLTGVGQKQTIYLFEHKDLEKHT